MTDQPFDPYHSWLGIPPEEQPPNHYELLGLKKFESKPEVIEAAANRQMLFVKQCGTGPHSEISQKLLNELSSARLILLNSEKKATYDAKLKKTLQAANAHEETPAPPAAPPIQIAADPSQSIVEQSKQKSKNSNLIIAGVVVVLLVGFGLFKLIQKPAEEVPPDNSVAVTNSDQPGENPTTETNSDNPASGGTNPADKSDPASEGSDDTGTSKPTIDPTPDKPEQDTTVASTNSKTPTNPKTPVTTTNVLPGPGSKPYLQFQGQSHVELANTTELLDLNGNFTIEMWVKIPPATEGQDQYLAGDDAWPGMNPDVKAAGTCGWVLRKRDGKLELSMGVGGENWYMPSGILPDSDDWQYIRIEKTGTSVGGFANGKTIFSSNSRERKFVPSPSNIFLGVRKFSYRDRSSDVAIRAFRLTASTPYRGNYTVPKSFEKDADTAALLDFSKGTGTQLADLSGNGHLGTINGAQWKQEAAGDTAVAQSSSPTVDLLKLIDLERDTVKGDFSLPDGTLTWQPAPQSRLQLPGDLPKEYDLVVTSSRTAQRTSGNGLMIGLFVGGYQTMAVVDGYFGNGLHILDGQTYQKNETFNNERGLFQLGKESTVVCSVRNSSVKVTFDGKTLIDWKGDPALLLMDERWMVPNKRGLFIGGDSVHTISRLELRPVSEASATPQLAGTPVNLLKKIDLERDTVKGEFTLENGILTWQQTLNSRLQIPYDGPEEYDLIITASRKTSRGFIALTVGLLVNDHQGMALIGGGNGSGLHFLDGKYYDKNDSSNRERGLFQPGKESTIVCSVRKSSIKITFDGKPLIDWKGDPTRLSLEKIWTIPDKQALFIGGNAVHSISRLELRPVGSSESNSLQSENPAQSLANRHQIPSEDDLKTAETLIKELFKDDYKNAKSSTKKAELGQLLLQKGIESQNNLLDRYVMLTEARRIATEGGDAATALDATKLLTTEFEMAVLESKVETIVALGKSTRFPAQKKPLAEKAFTLVDDAIAANDYKTATQLATIALGAARGARLRDFVKVITARRKEVDEVADEFEKSKDAIDLLKENPDDPAANLAVGNFLCFYKGDWENGLPMFVKSGDETLKSLAEKELAKPTTAEQKVAVGDGWWELAEDQRAAARKRTELHATYWYVESLSDVTDLLKLRIEKRLAVLEDKGLLNAPGSLKRKVAITAAGCNGHTIYLNGSPLMTCRRDIASSKSTTLKVGDLITVKLGDRFDVMSLWMIFQTEQKEKLFETSDRWIAYLPLNKLRWWEVDSEELLRKPAFYTPTSREYVTLVMSSAETALPKIKKSLPIASPLKGTENYSDAYLYYVLTAKDLLPNTKTKK